MSILHVNHIQADCRARFTSTIDMSDVQNASPADRDDMFLSRALAAFAIAAAAKVGDAAAAASVVDQYHDDGIDAFYYDPTEHVAYLVQSKWIKSGNSSVDLGATLKFQQGITHLIEGKITLLGSKMQARSADIQAALDDVQATFVLIVAYTGNQPLAQEVRAPLDQLIVELNEDSDLVSLQVLKQKDLWSIVENKAIGTAVDFEVQLKEYGHVKEPYKAYYGQVAVADIVAWGKFGDRLYHKNLRSFKGSTDVNTAIISTVKDDADNFFYFNNGITLLCGGLSKKPLGGKSTDSGVFECKDVSVINGAQTVGSIISAFAASNAAPSTARVMVKLISLESCPADFSTHVTRAANTQNRIENRDFAALDPEQTRLRTEMLLSLNKEYVFRSGDQAPDQLNGCTLDEATIALACANSDATHAVNAKQAIGRFYEDTTKPPYTLLFNSALSVIKLWRAIEVLRKVDAFLKAEQKKREGRERGCVVHGNRVLLHLIFKALDPAIFVEESTTPDAEYAKIPSLLTDYLTKVSTEIAQKYTPSYVGNIFKNITKCKAIVAAVA